MFYSSKLSASCCFHPRSHSLFKLFSTHLYHRDKCFSILGLDKSATSDQVKEAYRKLALKYHPDAQGQSNESESLKKDQRFVEIKEAYENLMLESLRVE